MSEDEMEELRLGAAARAAPRKVVQNTYIYTNASLQVPVSFFSWFLNDSHTFPLPNPIINESLLRHRNSETLQGILPLPRHLPD